MLRDDSGFTLLEMLVALAILAVGILGVLRAFSSSITASKAAESYSVAAMLAQQVAGEMERRPSLEPGEMSGTFAEGAPGFTWRCLVGEQTQQGLQTVRISVMWSVGQSPRHFDMTTCIRAQAPTGASQ